MAAAATPAVETSAEAPSDSSIVGEKLGACVVGEKLGARVVGAELGARVVGPGVGRVVVGQGVGGGSIERWASAMSLRATSVGVPGLHWWSKRASEHRGSWQPPVGAMRSIAAKYAAHGDHARALVVPRETRFLPLCSFNLSRLEPMDAQAHRLRDFLRESRADGSGT